VSASPGAGARDVVLAIDFGGTKMAVGCVTVDGRVLTRQRLPTLADRGADQAVTRALAAAAALRQEAAGRAGSAGWAGQNGQLGQGDSAGEHGAATQTGPGGSAGEASSTAGDRWRIAGVGAVSPGVILPDRIVLAPNVPGWEAISLPGLVAGALPGLPVATGNDVHAAALAEARWGRLRGIGHGLYVNVGTGLAAAIVIDGRVVTGAHHAAGEIGYARLAPAGHSPNGNGSVLAVPQVLEDLVGGRALGQRASEAAGRPLSAAGAFADPDPSVQAVVDEAISEFGRHLANFATLLDPERIVIGGGLMKAADRFLPALRHWLAKVVPFPPDVLASEFVTDASLLGAAALATDALAANAPALAGEAPPALAGDLPAL
jgi:glucokinase